MLKLTTSSMRISLIIELVIRHSRILLASNALEYDVRTGTKKASSSVADVSERESEEAQPAKKMLRSTLSKLGAATTSTGVGSRNPHVLPHICIICKSEKLYFTETCI